MTGVRSSLRQNDGKVRLSRGVSPRQSGTDEAAFLDGAIPHEGRAAHRDVVTATMNYNSVAVVVGKKPAPKKPVSKRPVSKKLVSRNPPRPVFSRLPALHAKARAAVTRTATGSVAVLQRAYGAVFSPDNLYSEEGAEQHGFAADLIRSLDSQRRAGGRVLAVALLVSGGWATLVPLSGAVVIPGTVVSESSVKKIQHPTGGLIAGIAVTDGMHVHEGDVLVRLDDTQVRSNFQVVTKQLEEVRARIARLAAERDGQTLASRAAARDRPGDTEQLLTSEN